MTRRKTHEEFVAEVHELIGEEYAIIGKYKDSETKITFRHFCGYEITTRPRTFLESRKKNHKCKKCAGLLKTHEDFIAEVYDLVDDEYTILDNYVNWETGLKMKHNECENIWSVSPNQFLSSETRCPKCAIKKNAKKQAKTHEQFLAEVFERVGNKYEVINGQYKNNKTKLEMKHNICNKIYPVTPDKFLQGKRCPKCAEIEKAKKQSKTHEQFIKEVFEKVGKEYTVTNKYITARIKIEMKHNNCGYIWELIPDSFLRGIRCPKCNSSKGETTILKWLEANCIYYQTQFKIEKCKNKFTLPFDFAVYKKDNSFILIEYQGQQHYKPVEIFGGEKGFKRTQKNDQIKKDYCEKNNIKLLEIPYWDFDNIDQILNEKLLPLDLMKQSNKEEAEQLELIFN